VNRGPRRISPFMIPGDHQHGLRQPVDHARLKGPNMAIVTACTTGLHCIGAAGRLIEYATPT